MPPKNKSINNIYEDDEDAEDDALIGSINSWQPPGRTGDGGGGGSGKEILFISLLILGTHGLFFTGQLGNLWSLSMSVEADLVIGGGNVSDDASTVG
eukprot:gene8998-25762_t